MAIIGGCDDCRKDVIERKGKIINGFLLKYTFNGQDYWICKCTKCFKKDPALRNFQKCEVYSRIVGYLRPVQQWNVGKQREYKERKNYKLKYEKKS